MSQFPMFSSGLEVANLVVSTNLLNYSLSGIYGCFQQSEVNPYQQQQQPLSLRCRIQKHGNCTVVAFVITGCTIDDLLQQGGADLVSSETLKQGNSGHLDFLCSKENPSFCINRAAITLFNQYFHDFDTLKAQLVDRTAGKLSVDTPLIITGNSLGGSVATLFTLWVLDSINPSFSKSKYPLCITFGSPLLGNKGLQRAVSEHAKWNSCFLNVVARQDPVPCLFIQDYRPFGTFLLCSQSGSTCAEDPEIVVHLLQFQAMGLQSGRHQFSDEQLLNYYGTTVENLKMTEILKGGLNLMRSLSVTDTLQAGLIQQLEAIGDQWIFQQLQHNMDIKDLIKKLKEREQICISKRRKNMNPSRKLNEIKIKMAYLEWYKKTCKKKAGYYDTYKNLLSTTDKEVTKHKKFLTNYWKEIVEEAEKKPQKEGWFIRIAWLYAGANYRRMVEPLDIAEYYKQNGKRNYKTEGRSKHYILLEKWQNEDPGKSTGSPSDKKKQNVANNLTEDSCFWADVEEALISCELLKNATSSAMEKHSSREQLIEFENDLEKQIKNYSVSPEIFLKDSSFMKWWREFKDSASNSFLINFMRNRRYVQYEKGMLLN